MERPLRAGVVSPRSAHRSGGFPVLEVRKQSSFSIITSHGLLRREMPPAMLTARGAMNDYQPRVCADYHYPFMGQRSWFCVMRTHASNSSNSEHGT